MIVALRGDEALYQEALREFYKQNWFLLKFSNFSRIELMFTRAVEHINKLEIWYVGLFVERDVIYQRSSQ